ncbi:InlB B-repeat-containing protein [Candidatus Saccharibacteria bacterium]|nr:InlB B-repeat-containing protein [Candidatus Saccharibacteria bacterium]
MLKRISNWRGYFVYLLGVVVSFVMVFFFFSNNVQAEAIQSTLTLNISNTFPFLSLAPGTFGVTTDEIISASTDNYSGYTLKIVSNGIPTLADMDENEFTSISTAISESTFRNDATYNNKFGYKPSQYFANNAVVLNTDFLPIPSNSGDTIDVTNLYNTTANSYTLSFGVKADTNMPAGTYSYVYDIVMVGNPVVYNITYDANSNVTPSNMPSPNPQVVNIDGGTPVADSYATLSNAVPTLPDMIFGGWCDVVTTLNSTTGNYECSGTTYTAGNEYGIDQTSDGSNIRLFAIWLVDPFPVVWSQMGACEFHGNTPSNITGSQCEDYWDSMFIDTGIALYSQQNASKDFEIHFTIDSYNPSTQVGNDNQQTFVNDKVSSTAVSSTIASGEAPGLIVRRNGSSIEFNSKMNSDQERPTVSTNTIMNGGGDISIFRLDHKIYYSINNGPLVLVQDITGFDQYFGLNTWFGGYPSDNCTGDNTTCTAAKRFIEATLSNMYIKLGQHTSNDIHEIEFSDNKTTPSTVATYLIKNGGSITTLPVTPTYADHLFQGWFTAQSGGTQVTAATVPVASTTYYAHWLATVTLANITNDSITLDPNDTETIIVTNSAELEPYTFASSNTSVATVNTNTGEITAIAPGVATITMTGATSGTTKTISVSVNGISYTVDFDAQGGSAVSSIPVGEGTSINPLPVSIKSGYNLMGWYTGTNGSGTQLTTSTVFDANTPTQYYAYWVEATYVCKIATTLHTESCGQTINNGCRSANYGSDAEIRYGSLVDSSTMTPGNAYNCDINYDGVFDETTERFYYFGTDNGNAKFVYYRNMQDTSSVYNNALALLPTSSNTGWDNPNLLTFSGDYNGTVARFMTYPEALALCDNATTNLGKNGRCLYLLEKSAFANTDITDGIWLERQPNNANRIQTRSLGLTHTTPTGTTSNAARPTIEVPLQYVEPYTPPVATYEITFDPHNGDNSFTETVVAGSALGNKYPSSDPTYTDYIFLGWFTEPSGGILVTDQTTPDGNLTYHAQWKGTVALAQVANNTIALAEGSTTTISVTNAADLEVFTYSSSDTSVAIVDSSTGAVTAVSQGTATISITGTSSHTTNSNIVTVNVMDPSTVFRVVFDPRNGDPTSFTDVVIGNAISSGMAQTPTYTNHAFQRWYDISNDATVTSATVPSSAMTVYAEWKLDVTQAVISNNDLTLAVGDQITVDVSNASQLETYTFSSANTSVVTVNANTGVITGVSEGTTNIIMTGVQSGLTKTLEVDVTAAVVTMWNVTFDANGGTTPTPYSSTEIEDGEQIGALPTTSRTNYRFFGWYTDDGTFYNEVTPETVVEDDVTYYARWIEDTTNFPIVFSEINECQFNGNAVISGTYCTQDKTKKYVNSGVALFSTANYQKDFEIGFTIVELASPQLVNQGTLVNSKYENSDLNYPGFVYRSLSTGPNFELTARFSNGTPTAYTASGATLRRVKIVRQSGILKYSINDGALTTWFDVSGNTHRFDTTVWFGASATSNNAPQRYLSGKLTDMYVKLGAPTDYLIDFDADGGSFANASDSSRTITIGAELGSLPVPTPPTENHTFVGWFDESTSPATQVSASTTPSSNITYVAHYSYTSSNTPVVFDVSNDATRGYQNLIGGWVQSPVNITTFNKATPINNSTWGDTTELSELQFWNGIRSNFINNGCLIPGSSDAVKPLSALSAWTSGSVDCSKPDVYDTKINSALTVRLNNAQGAVVSYAKADNGVIHNMIPGQTYYWEKIGDSSVYGYVTATSNKGTRWVDTGTIRNARDIGGLPLSYTDGNNQTVTGTVAYGRIFRGEKLNSALATELTNLGITTEYNVGDEYSGDTHLNDYHLNQVIHYNFDYNSGDENNPNSNYMKAWTAVTNIMTDITNANTTKNVYIHCRVGADRTGTVAYLLEGLLGVPDEDRYEEYALTNLSGLYDRTRYYKQKSSSNNEKFVFMMGFVKTNADIYNWYMQNPNASASLVNSFRTAMTVPSASPSPVNNVAPVNNTSSDVQSNSNSGSGGETKTIANKVDVVSSVESKEDKNKTTVDLDELQKQAADDLKAYDFQDNSVEPLGVRVGDDAMDNETNDGDIGVAIAAAAVASCAGITFLLAKQYSEAA